MSHLPSHRRTVLKLLAGAAFMPLAGAALAATPVWRDPKAPVALRVAGLLKAMTLEEKVEQMRAIWGAKRDMTSNGDFDAAKARQNFPNGIGQITRPSDRQGITGTQVEEGGTAARWRTPADNVRFNNDVQRWATEGTRLGIPVLFHEESLHGLMATEGTMFPQAIALAGSFDTDLMREVRTVIARETRARGVPFVLSPVVDIVRDPRWGRIEETFGECPHLVTEMGVAAVEGLQGTRAEQLAAGHVFACLKHMTGHGQPESGTNVGPAQIADRELRDLFFPPFRAAVERAGAAAVMPSYNEIDGIPSHASGWLLNDVLRGEWKFDGIVVSDYNGLQDMVRLHNIAADEEHAARLALAAGVDSELPNGTAFATLVQQVRDGRVSEALVDQAVARILTFKFRAGLFENPYGDAAETARITGNDEARALALKAAQRSICLLTNKGVLPLDAARLRKVAVIGPNAAIARLGGYSSIPKSTVSLLQGIEAKLAGKAEVVHAQGVFITQSEDRSANEVLLADPVKNAALIPQAVAVARDADVIILAIGDTEQTSREGFATHHLGDRTSIGLLGEQLDLFRALKATGRPVVVCAINGRPPSWPEVAAEADALLECWYPGQEGGTAMADVLFGTVNPGAKLPVTVVRNEGQIPHVYYHKPSARRAYLLADNSPLFPFGHGLSYSSFSLSAPMVSAREIRAGQPLNVSVELAHQSGPAGDEVVQIYIRREQVSVTQPILLLKAFQRVHLRPGERRRITLTLPPEAFRFTGLDGKDANEPGPVTIFAGNSSASLQSTTIRII